MFFRTFWFALVAVACASTSALAAPFCIESSGVARECIYYDAKECRDRAAQLSSLCIANHDEVSVYTGNGYYCLVDSSHSASCIYIDRDTCNKDAVKTGGACVDSRSVATSLDPFTLDPNRNY